MFVVVPKIGIGLSAEYNRQEGRKKVVATQQSNFIGLNFQRSKYQAYFIIFSVVCRTTCHAIPEDYLLRIKFTPKTKVPHTHASDDITLGMSRLTRFHSMREHCNSSILSYLIIYLSFDPCCLFPLSVVFICILQSWTNISESNVRAISSLQEK